MPGPPVGGATHFPDVTAFVTGYLAGTYIRDVSGRAAAWCPRWWAHAEAVARLDALWRSWEALRTDPDVGLSVWLRDHADPHMAVLFDPDGTFKGCSPEKGHRARPLPPLPTEPAPDGHG